MKNIMTMCKIANCGIGRINRIIELLNITPAKSKFNYSDSRYIHLYLEEDAKKVIERSQKIDAYHKKSFRELYL